MDDEQKIGAPLDLPRRSLDFELSGIPNDVGFYLLSHKIMIESAIFSDE